MSSAKRNTQKNLIKASYVKGEASGNESGAIVAAFEVMPQDAAIMSLGIFEEDQPPKSFLIDYYPEVDESLIKTEITAQESFTGGWHYLLQIANFSGKMLCAEIREVVVQVNC